MNSPVENKQTQHLRTTYILINAILFAPILLWPVPLLIFDNPMLADVIIPKWHLSIIILLIASVSMDSLMYGAKNLNQSIYHTLWIAAISLLAIQNENNTWVLAVLFLIHSLRLVSDLLQKGTGLHLWLKIGWVRDIATSATILSWFHITTP